MAIRTASTVGMEGARARASFMSEAVFTRFPRRVATASARAVLGEMTITASALPKLREGPTVADEVQTPRGKRSGASLRAIFPVKGERGPAKMPTEVSSRRLNLLMSCSTSITLLFRTIFWAFQEKKPYDSLPLFATSKSCNGLKYTGTKACIGNLYNPKPGPKERVFTPSA
jgi:hypothetical protein